MLLQSTDTVVLETAFLDELSKIADAHGEGSPEEEHTHPWITKERLKRLAIVAPIVGLGTGAGYTAGKMARRAMNVKRLEKGLRRAGVAKYIPHAMAIGGGLLSAQLALKSRLVRKYTEAGDKKDERK